VADAPELKKLGRLQGHGAYYGCSVCIGKEQRVQRSTGNYKLAWPTSSVNCFPRTKALIWDCVERREEDQEIHLGVLGWSLLFELNSGEFDITKQLLPEAMHMCYHGVTKHLLTLTIGGLKMASGNAPHGRVSPLLVDRRLRSIRNPTEVTFGIYM
jgi:hypothetical protein